MPIIDLLIQQVNLVLNPGAMSDFFGFDSASVVDFLSDGSVEGVKSFSGTSQLQNLIKKGAFRSGELSLESLLLHLVPLHILLQIGNLSIQLDNDFLCVSFPRFCASEYLAP